MVVTAPFESKCEKQCSSESSLGVSLVDLHTSVAEHSDVSHRTVKQESLMDVVGRDQARRGQPADKPVTRSVRYQDREHDQRCENDREMLARGSELDGDNECQQDIDIGIESELHNLECDQEFNQ